MKKVRGLGHSGLGARGSAQSTRKRDPGTPWVAIANLRSNLCGWLTSGFIAIASQAFSPGRCAESASSPVVIPAEAGIQSGGDSGPRLLPG